MQLMDMFFALNTKKMKISIYWKVGLIMLCVETNDKKIPFLLQDVLCVPDSTANLLSISQATMNGITAVLRDTSVQL
jgi:hypothetical protein